ncbi:MAG: hypothetical protein WCW26_02680 [Candidatus Buchananbacteria bacterium]
MDFIKTINSRKTEITVLLVLVFELVFPHYAVAAEPKNSIIKPNFVIKAAENPALASNSKVNLLKPVKVESTQPEANLSEKEAPKVKIALEPAKEVKVVKTYENVPITAYSSTVGQTDSDPCTTANGYNLCEHNEENAIAANFLKFGTKVRIPEYFGDRIFIVQDRMNARYHYRADVWFRSYNDAVRFGIVYAKIEIVE